MSILIKGMKMPESCWMCFARTDVNIGVGIADGCNLLKEMISNPNERLPDCPLVPVPPHGRLIDADADIGAYVTVWDCNCPEFGKQTVMAVDDLQYLPTIIQAEEEET